MFSVLQSFLGFAPGPEALTNTSSVTPATQRPLTNPTPDEAFHLRNHILIHLLPVELVDIIIDLAHYHARSYASQIPARPTSLAASSGFRSSAASLFVVCPPIVDRSDPGLEDIHVKRVGFRTVSCDQGWSGEHLKGTYHGSWTWFEAMIIRPDPTNNSQAALSTTTGPLDISESYIKETFPGEGLSLVQVDGRRSWPLQRNVHADSTKKQHEIVWTPEDTYPEPDEEGNVRYDDEDTGRGYGRGFLGALKVGDQVAVVARAQYPGWVNIIDKVEVEVLYTV